MRLSSLSVAAVLLFSSIASGQHTPPSAPSTPPPSPPPSTTPSTPPPASTPSPAPSISTSATSNVSVSHSGASSPSPASVPENRVAPSPGPATSPVSVSAAPDFNSNKVAPVLRAPESAAQRVIPDEKISGGQKVVTARRIGENPPEKEHEPQPAQPDLRRRICDGGPCKEPQPWNTAERGSNSLSSYTA